MPSDVAPGYDEPQISETEVHGNTNDSPKQAQSKLPTKNEDGPRKTAKTGPTRSLHFSGKASHVHSHRGTVTGTRRRGRGLEMDI